MNLDDLIPVDIAKKGKPFVWTGAETIRATDIWSDLHARGAWDIERYVPGSERDGWIKDQFGIFQHVPGGGESDWEGYAEFDGDVAGLSRDFSIHPGSIVFVKGDLDGLSDGSEQFALVSLSTIDTMEAGKPHIWRIRETTRAKHLFQLAKQRGGTSIQRYEPGSGTDGWLRYAEADGLLIPGSEDFEIRTGDVFWITG